MPTDSLRTAYLAALYRFGPVQIAGLIELRVGHRSDALHSWLQDGRHQCATVLTAFNPGSHRCSDEFNAHAQQQLRDALQSRGLPFIEGRNLDPAGHWPVEDSLLIADLSLTDSGAMAHHFGQLAFLWSDTTAVPQLHFTGQQEVAQR